jgi:hypothetical protein
MTQCKNNLKQIGLAFHNHHDTLKAFPSGGTYWSDTARALVNGSPADFESQSWGWAYQILPYHEQTNTWQETDDNKVGATLVRTYVCPTVSQGQNARLYTYTQTGVNTKRIMADYTANGGTWGWWGGLDETQNALDGAVVPSRTRAGATASGKQRIFSDMTDGTSTSLLVAEKWLTFRSFRSNSPSCNDDQGWVDGWDNDTICFGRGQYATDAPRPPLRFARTLSGTCGLYFGSIHEVMNAAFCDGSVHRIRFNIDPIIWVRLTSVRDGDPVGDFE